MSGRLSRVALSGRLAAMVLATAVLGSSLTACGDEPSAEEAGSPTASGEPSPDGSASPTAEPSLPPGDPGLQAPSVPDPGTAGPEEEEAPLGRVPLAAVLDAETVGMALGGTWTRRPGGAENCTLPPGPLAGRTVTFQGGSGVVTQTVLTYAGHEAGDSAVRGLGAQLAGCGWTLAEDPRLGSASVAARDAERMLTAVSAEGVVLVLVARGPGAGDAAGWAGVVDLAIGSSCPAAPDGCH